jgi:hypothetical protein
VDHKSPVSNCARPDSRERLSSRVLFASKAVG